MDQTNSNDSTSLTNVPHGQFSDQIQTDREEKVALEGAAWFAATVPGRDRHLLRPLDDTVNYAVVFQYADTYTVELAVEKYWKQDNDSLGVELVTLNTYEPEPENEDEVAAMDKEELLYIYGKQGLVAMMQEAWQIGVDNEYLDADDPTLFSQGPQDRFQIVSEPTDPAIEPIPDDILTHERDNSDIGDNLPNRHWSIDLDL